MHKKKQLPSGYANVCITMNDLLKMLLGHFWYYHISNSYVTFAKSFIKKLTFLRRIFKLFSKLYYATNFMFWQQLIVKWRYE